MIITLCVKFNKILSNRKSYINFSCLNIQITKFNKKVDKKFYDCFGLMLSNVV